MSNTSIVVPTSLSPPQSPPERSGEPLLSASGRQLALDVLLYLRYIAVVIAVPLTLLNILVFLQPRMRNATSVYVIGLSLAQLYYVIVTSVLSVLETSLEDPFNNYGFVLYNLYASVYGGIVVRRGSYVVMCLVSLERLYAIVRPFHVKRFLLSRRPLMCLILGYTITAVLHTYILAKTMVRRTVSKDGEIVVRFVPTELYLKHKDINNFFSLAAKILLTYIALLLQILLNVMTVWCLRRHNVASSKSLQASMSDDVKKAQERQLTVTILAATVGYVTLSIPAALHNLIYTVMPETYGAYGTYNNVYVTVYNLAFVLTVLSSAVDFFCFYALSSNYRVTFFQIFKIKRQKQIPDLHSADSVRQTSENRTESGVISIS